MTAENHRLVGDQELAYIFYMKYFNMLSAIREQSSYTEHKVTVREVLGDAETNRRIMDTLETISNSLEKRYELLNPSPSSPSPSTGLQQKTPLMSASNANIVAGTVSSPGTDASGDGHPLAFTQLGVISCEALFQRMQKQSVLVMDCRSSTDYDNSHLTYYCAFNVPEELITPG